MKLTRICALAALTASLGLATGIGSKPVDVFTDYSSWARDSARVAAKNKEPVFSIQSYGFLNNVMPPNWGVSNTAWNGHAPGIDTITNYQYNLYDGKFAYDPVTGQIASYAATSFVVPPYSVGIAFDINAIASPYPNDPEGVSIQLTNGSTYYFQVGGNNGSSTTPAFDGTWGFVANHGQDIVSANFLSGTASISTLYAADPVETPEPGSWVLVLVGSAVLLFGSLRFRQAKTS